MNASEASRQYQLALEHERRARHEFAGVLTAEREIADAELETHLAREQLLDALVARVVS